VAPDNGPVHPVSATLYIGPEDPIPDMNVVEKRFSRTLATWGLPNDLRIKADHRFVGRAPLLVIDGGKLAECPTNFGKLAPVTSL
jgi:hypothetical protein